MVIHWTFHEVRHWWRYIERTMLHGTFNVSPSMPNFMVRSMYHHQCLTSWYVQCITINTFVQNFHNCNILSKMIYEIHYSVEYFKVIHWTYHEVRHWWWYIERTMKLGIDKELQIINISHWQMHGLHDISHNQMMFISTSDIILLILLTPSIDNISLTWKWTLKNLKYVLSICRSFPAITVVVSDPLLIGYTFFQLYLSFLVS
jgi:hypothetical protein